MRGRAIVGGAAAMVMAMGGAVAVLYLPAASGAPEDGSPKRVVSGKGHQYFGVLSGSYVGWSEGSSYRQWEDRTLVRTGNRTIVIDPAKGGAVLNDIFGDTAIYENAQRGNSDVKFFDLTTKKTRNPPKGVNTKAMERRATRSGDFLLFSRIIFKRRYRDYRYAREQVVLYNLQTRKRRILVDAHTDRGRYALPGQINGDWAVWYDCGRRRCGVKRMNLTTRKVSSSTTKRPVEYAPSVTSSGTVFFAASGYTCGTRVQLYRWPRGGSPRVVYNEGKGIETINTYALTLPDGTERVVFDLLDCSTESGDVYRMDFAGSGSASPSPSPSPSGSACGLPVCPPITPLPDRRDGGA